MPIRRAAPADLPAILEMMADFNAHEQIAWTRAAGEAPLRALMATPALGVVGVIGAEPLGYFVLTWGFDLEWGGRDAFLTELYLRPSARGQGRAGPAVAAIEALAREHGARALHLMVRHDNAPARQVYARAGFVDPGRLLLSKPL